MTLSTCITGLLYMQPLSKNGSCTPEWLKSWQPSEIKSNSEKPQMVILLSWHNITSDTPDMSASACSSVCGVYAKHGERKQRQTTRTCTSYQHITNRTGQPMGRGLKQPLFVRVSKCFRCPHAISEVHIFSEKLAHRNALFSSEVLIRWAL